MRAFLGITFPFVTFISIICWGRNMGNIGSAFLAIVQRTLSVVALSVLLHDILKYDLELMVNLGNWIDAGSLKVDWIFLINELSIIRLFTVGFISLMVHIYSLSYRREDPHLGRFRAYLSLFTAFMYLLIAADNLLIFYVGWEGIGLCSFLLIGFWYDRPQAIKASLKAILYNRIGDVAYLIAMGLMYSVTQTLNFSIIELIYQDIYALNPKKCEMIALLLLLSVMAKSAQIFRHLWLPDAREGPTPVSALIHAATRVTAGIYLRLRLNCIFRLNKDIAILITVVGALTALFGSYVALFQYDLKRIIAFSTCSQLGYMAVSVGMNKFEAAFGHLIRHAYFKALLFLCAGVIIHNLNNEQDIQKMGGLKTIRPFAYITTLIGNLSLCAVIGTSGYYSKELIIEEAYILNMSAFKIVSFSLYISAILTILYTSRLRYYVFYRKTNIAKYNLYKENKHTLSYNIIIPLSILSILSRVLGYLVQNVRAESTGKFSNCKIWEYDVHADKMVYTTNILDHEYNSIAIKQDLLKIYILVTIRVVIVNVFKRVLYALYFSKTFQKIFKISVDKLRLDKIYNSLSLKALSKALDYFYLQLDKFSLELYSILGLKLMFINIKDFNSKLNNTYSKIFYIFMVSIIISGLILSFL